MSGTERHCEKKYVKPNQILFIKKGQLDDEWGKGAPLLPLYDREAAAGRRLREQTFQQYCFWPCGAPASHLHHSVCSTLLCLKQRCRCTVFISELNKKKKHTHKLCLFWGRGRGWGTRCHQRINFHFINAL